MDFVRIWDPFLEVFYQNGHQSRKWRFYEKPIKTLRKTLLFEGLGHALRDQNKKTASKTEWILEVMSDGFRLYFGDHFGG